MDKTKILVIDDEEGIRLLISSILEKEGYEISLAEDGYKAVELFRKEVFDLVITDIRMPGMDGIEVLKRLKEIDPDAVVIILTGHGTLDTAIAAIKESAYDFVTKPLDKIQKLASAVRNGVRKRRLTLQNKALLTELKETNEKLIKKNQNYFEVLGFVSHELRNAMTIVSGFVSLFQEGMLGELDDQQKDIMNKISYNIEFINNLIINYLSLSKIEKNELHVEKREFDIYNDVLKDVIDAIKMQAHHNRLNVAFSFDGIQEGIRLNADSELLRIVFLNLLINAMKYSKDGGKIICGYKERGDTHRFNVYNEGSGIPDEYKEKIFEKFIRIKAKSVKEISGSGLGLFTVKNIVNAHSGKIWVESKVGKWTDFIFELPK